MQLNDQTQRLNTRVSCDFKAVHHIKSKYSAQELFPKCKSIVLALPNPDRNRCVFDCVRVCDHMLVSLELQLVCRLFTWHEGYSPQAGTWCPHPQSAKKNSLFATMDCTDIFNHGDSKQEWVQCCSGTHFTSTGYARFLLWYKNSKYSSELKTWSALWWCCSAGASQPERKQRKNNHLIASTWQETANEYWRLKGST